MPSQAPTCGVPRSSSSGDSEETMQFLQAAAARRRFLGRRRVRGLADFSRSSIPEMRAALPETMATGQFEEPDNEGHRIGDCMMQNPLAVSSRRVIMTRKTAEDKLGSEQLLESSNTWRLAASIVVAADSGETAAGPVGTQMTLNNTAVIWVSIGHKLDSDGAETPESRVAAKPLSTLQSRANISRQKSRHWLVSSATDVNSLIAPTAAASLINPRCPSSSPSQPPDESRCRALGHPKRRQEKRQATALPRLSSKISQAFGDLNLGGLAVSGVARDAQSRRQLSPRQPEHHPRSQGRVAMGRSFPRSLTSMTPEGHSREDTSSFLTINSCRSRRTNSLGHAQTVRKVSDSYQQPPPTPSPGVDISNAAAMSQPPAENSMVAVKIPTGVVHL